MSSPPGDPSAKPGFRDWLWLAISLAFVAAGVLVFVNKPGDRDGAIASTAFFAACAAVAAINLARKLRYRRLRPLRVEVVGGTPLRPPRSHVVAMGVSLLVLGSILVVFGRSISFVLWAIGWLIRNSTSREM